MLRVNARLNDDYAQKLEFLTESEGLCVSDVVKNAIDRYYEAAQAEQARRLSSLDALVGAFDGDTTPEDLSANYKHYAQEAITQKFAATGHDADR